MGNHQWKRWGREKGDSIGKSQETARETTGEAANDNKLVTIRDEA